MPGPKYILTEFWQKELKGSKKHNTMLFLLYCLPLGNQTDSTLEQAHVKFNLAPQDLTYYPWPTLFTTYKAI